MKLLVNVDCLQAPLTGIGHYARNLLRELSEESRIEDIQAVRASGWASPEELSRMLAPHSENDSVGNVGGGEAESGFTGSIQRKSVGIIRDVVKRIPYARALKRQLQSRVAQARENELAAYLYWEPNYNLLPIGNTALTTVHDLSHIHYPEFHPKERVDMLNNHLPDSIARAKKVITVSEFTRGEVSRHFGIAEEQILVVPPAASAEFKPYDEPQCEWVRQHYQLPSNYILSVGTLEPRKNLLGLIQAFSRLPSDYRDAYPLVLVGGKGWHTGAITEALATLPEQQVFRLGYVSQYNLPKLVAAATVMAYPSYYEGFGMPVLEAMAAGTPVLTSSCSSMPEVSGGASILIEPTEVASITEGLRQLLDNESLRNRCREEGLINATRYSWQSSAEKLLAGFQQCRSL